MQRSYTVRAMIDAMLRAALLILPLAGCDVIFRVDRISGAPPDAAARDTVSADATVGCTQPFLDDSFDAGEPCTPWGTVRSELGGMVTETNGGLVVQPAPNVVGSRGGCNPVGMVPWSGGAMVEVAEAISGTAGEFTMLSSGSLNIAVAVANGQIAFQNDIGTVPYGQPLLYSPTVMRFWRIRPNGDTTIVGEYSADALTWKPLGDLVVAAVPATASFGLLAGLNLNQPAQSAPDRAVYERFVVCP